MAALKSTDACVWITSCMTAWRNSKLLLDVCFLIFIVIYTYSYSASSTETKKRVSTPDFVRDYIERLESLYTRGTRFTQPDWPPIKIREPTNLVIIGKYGDIEESFTKEKIETMNDDYVHGEVVNITAYKKEIKLADILRPVPSEDGKSTNEPKVLMDGAPGVG